MTRAALAFVALAVACASVPPERSPAPPVWSQLAGEQTVQVVTVDPDGDERVTTVWLVVVDGVGVIRTFATRWFANLERDPTLRLRAVGNEYPLRIERVESAEESARIDAAFREKYGFADRFILWIRGREANRMRLVPR